MRPRFTLTQMQYRSSIHSPGQGGEGAAAPAGRGDPGAGGVYRVGGTHRGGAEAGQVKCPNMWGLQCDCEPHVQDSQVPNSRGQ